MAVTDPLEDVYAAGAAHIETAIGVELERVAGFVRDAEIPAVVSQGDALPGPPSAGDGGNDSIIRSGGQITQEQFAALNQCEASGENGFRTGRYGLEDGTGNVGSRSDAEQQAQAQQIFDQYGAHAWGPLCAPILGG